MPKVLGAKKLAAAFRALKVMSERTDDVEVVVGYTAKYALYVHENMKARHSKPAGVKTQSGSADKRYKNRSAGQAKYLEQPFREMQPEIIRAIKQGRKKKVPLLKTLLVAGLKIQRASQKLVPVDTGNLRGSAFTEEE